MNAYEYRESLTCALVDTVDSKAWGFQPAIDTIARGHLNTLIIDNWPQSTATEEDQFKDELVTAAATCYDKTMREYKRFCQVAKLKYAKSKRINLRDMIERLLLLLMVHGEADIIRTQNHACFLLYYAALERNQQDKSRMNSPLTPVDNEEAVQLNTSEQIIDIPLNDSVQEELEPTPNNIPLPQYKFPVDGRTSETVSQVGEDFLKEDSFSVIGQMIRNQANFLYRLITITYDAKRLEQLFDWDDINDLCWTPKFCKTFLTENSFQKAFHMGEFPQLLSVIDHPEHAIIDKHVLVSELEKFSKRWRTHKDASGGYRGWRGKFSILCTYGSHAQFQLFALFVTLCVYFNFDLVNWKKVAFALLPIIPMCLIAFCQIIHRFMTLPYGHKHFFSIPALDDKRYRHEKWYKSFFIYSTRSLLKYSVLITIIIGTCIVAVFGMLPYLSLATRYILILDYLTGTNSTLTIGNQTESFANYVPRPGESPLDISTLTVKMAFDLAIGNAQLVVLWMTVSSLFWLLPYILFMILLTIIGYIIGFFKYRGGVTSWKALKAIFGSKRLLHHFQTKLMNISSKGMSKRELKALQERVEWSWALVWNDLVRSLYENYQLNEDEFKRYSYTLETDERILHEEPRRIISYKILHIPDLQKQPSNRHVVSQLCNYVNGLTMSMPSNDILTMKKLVVLMPVCQETVRISWEELTKPNNTERSLFHILLKRYSSEWENFKNKEFVQGSRMRQVVDEMESKVLAGVSVTSHMQKRLTMHYIKKLITHWASQRFLTVTRSARGFMQIPRAMSILLRIQHPELLDSEIEKIIPQKFSFILGPRLYDEQTWRYEMLYYETLTEDEREALDNRHFKYQNSIHKLAKELGSNVTKIAHLENTPEDNWIAVLREWDDFDAELKTIHQVDCMVDPRIPIGSNYKVINDAIMRQFFDGSLYQRANCHMDIDLCQAMFFPNTLREFSGATKTIAFSTSVYNASWSYSLWSYAFLDRMTDLTRQFGLMLGFDTEPTGHEVIDGTWAMFTANPKMIYLASDHVNAFCNVLHGANTKHVGYFRPQVGYNVDVIADANMKRQMTRSMAHVATSRFAVATMRSYYTGIADSIFLSYLTFVKHTNHVLLSYLIYTAFLIRIVTGITSSIMLLVAGSVASLVVDPNLTQILNIMIETSCAIVLLHNVALQTITGLLATILEYGLVRGIVKTIRNYFSVLTLMFFIMSAERYHFDKGLQKPARQIIMETSHGTHHRAVVDMYRMLKLVHFFPSLLLFIAAIVGAVVSATISVYSYLFLLVMMLSWAPFVYNPGSFPVGVSYQTWIRLFTDDYQCIKTWFLNNCSLLDVENIMRRDKSYQRMAFQTDDTAHNVELDLEFKLTLDAKRNSTHRPSIVELEDHKKKDEMIDLSITSIAQKARPKSTMYNLPTERGSIMSNGEGLPALPTRIRRTPRENLQRFYNFFAGGFIQARQRVLATFEQLYLLLVLTGVKIVSYFFLLWAVVMPWTEPPNTKHIYRENFEKKIIEGRIIGIQRMIKKGQLGDDTHTRKQKNAPERRFSTMELLRAIEQTRNVTAGKRKQSAEASLPKSRKFSVFGRVPSPMSLSIPTSGLFLDQHSPTKSPLNALRKQSLGRRGSTHSPISSSPSAARHNITWDIAHSVVIEHKSEEVEKPEESIQIAVNAEELDPEQEKLVKQLETVNTNFEKISNVLDIFLEKMETGLSTNTHSPSIEAEYQTVLNHILENIGMTVDEFSTLTKQCLQDVQEYDFEPDGDLDFTILKIAQLGASYQVIKTKQTWKEASVQIAELTKSRTSNEKNDPKQTPLARSKRATCALRDACQNIINEYFELIVFNTGNDQLIEQCKGAMTRVCESMAAKSTSIAKSLLREGKREFKRFTVRLGQSGLYGYGPARCYACVVQRKRLDMLQEAYVTIEGALILAQRLLKGVDDEKSVKPIVENDDGKPFFSQCFKRLEESFMTEVDDAIAEEKEFILQGIQEAMNSQIETEEFVSLCNDVAEMLQEARKQKKIIEDSHNHKAKVVKNVPQLA